MNVILLALALLAGCRDKPAGSARPEPEPEAEPPLSACAPPSGEVGAPAVRFAGDPPRNLLVISIDTLRRDRIGRYSGGDTTPFLDGLLAESVVLDDMRACANWTMPGVLCSMLGQSTLDLGYEPLFNEEAGDEEFLPVDLQTLATWLADAGWEPSLVTTSKLFSDYRPTGNGFGWVAYENDATADWVVDQAFAALQQHSGESPWYLHLHFRDPHAPYAPPAVYQGDLAGADLAPFDPRTDDGVLKIIGAADTLTPAKLADLQEAIDKLYAGEVRFLDAELARLWDALSAQGYLDDTLVVFWSDHGEQNFEHGAFQHGKSLHAEEAMALGAFWARGIEPAAVAAPHSQEDIAPTVLEALGVPIPGSVTGVVVGTEPEDRARLSTSVDEADRPVHTADRNGHRLMYSWTGERAYYHYLLDPAEEKDRYDAEDEDVQCLWDLLRPAMARVDEDRAGGPPVDPE